MVSELPKFIVKFINSLRHGRALLRLFVAAVVCLPLLLVWLNPYLITYAIWFVVALWVFVLWRQWSGWSRIPSWLSAGLVLMFFWSSAFMVWLFLEATPHRFILIALLAFFSWWYLREWQRLRLTMFLGEAGAGSTPTLALGFFTCFALSTAAEGFLVFLNMPVWLLTLVFALPMVLLLICFVHASGWSLVKKAGYWLVGAVVIIQVFLLASWWPTSFYVVGFVVAATFAVVALVLRQEAQGFISRRSFSRELSLVLGALLIVILTARWY